MNQHRPLLLIIFDGFGYREQTEYNAIAQANTPNFDQLWQACPHTLLQASGDEVGLPAKQMGNSEVGHMNLGAGRIVRQDFSRITHAIESGEFETNATLNQCLDDLKQSQKALHIFGLLSPGGVHSHEQHIRAMLAMAHKKGIEHVYIHAFLDGRDTPPQSAGTSIKRLDELCERLNCGRIASIVGRYYVMDRDKRWERVAPAYQLLTTGKAKLHADDALQGLQLAYDRGETDEFVQATAIGDAAPMQDGDAVIFCNFRADRARQISHAFLDDDFDSFKREQRPQLSHYVCFTEYDASLNAEIAFPPQTLHNVFGEYIADQGLTQLRIAETEKYAHVTFFFNGGHEQPFKNEDRELIASPKVATYDLQPEMSAPELTDKLTAAITADKYDVIICNYANADMVGHTGKMDAAIKAITCLDQCLGKVVQALKTVDGELMITADHGNADCMYDTAKEQPLTSHTTNLVPFIYMGRNADICKENGSLSDIASTMLYVLGLDIPKEMTGQSLLKWHE